MRLAALVIASTLLPQLALAHDHWISQGRYTNPKTGELCCGKEDCLVVPDQDVKATPQGYALVTGEVVPYAEAQKSEDGRFWRCHRFDAAKSRRCFFAPEPAS